jgi:CHAT domain-containing protein
MKRVFLASIRLASAITLGAFQTGSALPRPEALVQIISLDLGRERTLEGRLFGITAYQPLGALTAARHKSVRDLGPDALSGYAAIRRQLAARREPHILRIAGQAELLMGRTSAARALFDECLAHPACAPDTWSDLAAVYLRQADEDGTETGAELTARAIDAAAKATSLAPMRPYTWFNLGVGLARIHLDRAAHDAWTRYLMIEPSEAWRSEARERLARKSDVAATKWSALKAALIGSDDVPPADLSAIASTFAQQGRDFLLEELLPLWGRAWLAGQWDDASARLARAQAVVELLERVDGDRLLTACVARVTEVSQDRMSGTARDLAGAHVAYGEGRRLFEANRREQSAVELSNASRHFRAAESPCVAWADVGLATTQYFAGDVESARAQFAATAGLAQVRGHWALLGRAQWNLGVSYAETAAIEAGLKCFAESGAAFERAREMENEAAVAGAAAYALLSIGEHKSAWQRLGHALKRLDRIVSVRRRYQLLFNASLFAADAELMWTALAFQRASLDAAHERGVANTIVEGLVRQARLHLQVGNVDEALADLADASRRLPGIASQSSLEYQKTWLDRVRAEISIASQPSESLRLIDEAMITSFGKRQPDQVPLLLLARGRAALNAKDVATADTSFRRGLEVFQTQWRGLASPEHRVSYTDESWDLFDELIRLRAVQQDDWTAALRYAEISRGQHAGLEPAAATNTLSISEAPTTAGTDILYYVSLNDRLLGWRLGAGSARFANLQVGRAELAQLVGAYRQAIQSAESSADVRPLGAALYTRLVHPLLPDPAAVRTLVIIPDGALYALPFSSLVEPVTGHFLFEDRSIVVAPSLTLYRRAQDRSALLSRQEIRRALLVGAPVNPDPLLAPLPGAGAELALLAGSYPSPIVLSGAVATPAAFGRLAETADVIHFAGHAKANLAFPRSSSLILSPDATHSSGLLSAREIATWNLPGTRLAVLGACQTAYGALYRGEGLMSLARPFLDVGVPSVVGALWDVDDRVTSRFLVQFHREYARIGDSGSALVAAQRQLLNSPDPTLSLPRNWSAFLAFGASGTGLSGK